MNQDKKNILKRAIRRKVFSGSELLRKKNKENNIVIIPSKKYPTEIINRERTKYIRINEEDIKEDIDNLLSMMLGMDEPNEENIEDELRHSYKLNKELDGIEIDIPDNIEDLPINLKEVTEDEYEDEERKEEENHTIVDDLDKLDIRDFAAYTKKLIKEADVIGESKDLDGEPKKDIVEEEIEQSLKEVEQIGDNKTFGDNVVNNYIKSNLPLANKLAKSLIKALKGKNGKSKSINPSKRISSRDVILDRDKIYITKKMNQGKEIEMNLMIDMSGSMGGTPVNNAVLITYIFNQLAKQGLVKMNVIYSSSRARDCIKLPVKDSDILCRKHVFGDEGLRKSSETYVKILQNKNLICITDADIVDEPINKKFWQKNRIVSTGIYVTDMFKEQLKIKNKGLLKWFNHAIARPNIESLIQTLIRIGLS
jgi:hypothetical protein